MDRFKSLPSVILGADGKPLKFAEELAIVIGLAAEKVKNSLQHDEETLYINTRRLAVASVVAVVVIAALVMGWLQSQGLLASAFPWVIGGTILALLGIAAFYILAPRTERFGVQDEHAAVTRVGLFYWPVGILPLSEERSVLWDPLTSPDALLHVMELPPELGVAEQSAVESAERPDDAFAAMLGFSDALGQIRPQAVTWLGNEPDSSAQQVGAEVADLWRQMVGSDIEELHGTIRAAQDGPEWKQVGAAGATLHTFYTSIEALRERVEAYRSRAERMVDAAREVLVEHGWQTISRVQDERAQHFPPGKLLPGLGNRAIPTAPSAHLLLTPADSATGVQESLVMLRTALAPLDEAVALQLQRHSEQEATDLQRAEQRFSELRRALDDDKRQVDLIDAEILTLAATLDSQQARIADLSAQIQNGFTAIAQVPLAELQRQLLDVHTAMREASALIGDVAGKIQLESIEQTLKSLMEVTGQAHGAWQRLAEEMPKRGEDVIQRVERVLTHLTTLEENPNEESKAALQRIQSSVREVDRVARTVTSWSSSQLDPLDPVEDQEAELGQHLVALRDQRAKLEKSSAILTALSEADSGRPVTLPDAIQRVESALAHFIQLSQATSAAVAALHNAADTVRTQSEMIARLLGERNALRTAFQQRLAAFQQQEADERASIRGQWQQARERLEVQRGDLERIQESAVKRLTQERAAPTIGAVGVIMDETTVTWPDRLINQMGHGVDLWGQRVAGVDGAPSSGTQVERLHHDLEECYQELRARAVPTTLTRREFPLEPQICFVPFWYVETETKPGAAKNPGRFVHLFPPLHLDRPSPTEAPRVESLRYRELSRRLLTYLRRDFVDGKEAKDSLSFDPAVMTEAGQRLDLADAAPPLSEVATALAQHWVFFRTPDPQLNRIIQNSRDQLIPETQILEAWSAQSAPTQPSLPRQGARVVELPPEGAPPTEESSRRK